MGLKWLKIGNFRNLTAASLHPGPGMNWFYGDNAAGKTSVLEAIHLLGRGRSFRSATVAPLIQTGCEKLGVIGGLDEPATTIGIERTRTGWRGRIGGADCRRISEFARHLPLVLIEPGSHQLIEGGPDQRRSYLDWGLFHVEPDYLARWRRYARLLRQRNAALKRGGADPLLDALEKPMAEAAESIDRARIEHVAGLAHGVDKLQQQLGLRFEPPVIEYRPGQEPAQSLRGAWHSARARDRELGYTRHGPHRADLKLTIDGRSAAPRLSRGQQKLCSLLLLLGLLERLRSQGRAPVLLLDDPVSELDRDHLMRVLGWLGQTPVQSWLTGVERPPSEGVRLFHVEQGEITPVV